MQVGAGYTLFGYTITNQELFIAASVLLMIAAVMMMFSRRKRIAVHRSLVTDELMLHLSRIADALERQANRPVQQYMPDLPRHEDSSSANFGEQPHSIAYSMFGR